MSFLQGSEVFHYKGRAFRVQVFTGTADAAGTDTVSIASASSGNRHVVVGFFDKSSLSTGGGYFMTATTQIGQAFVAPTTGLLIAVRSILPYWARTNSGEALQFKATTGAHILTASYITVPGSL